MHLWYEQRFGVSVQTHLTLDTVVAAWPETATAIAVRLEEDDQLSVIAPFGLDDLFGVVWRHNPTLATAEMYAKRLAEKQPWKRWSRLQVVSPEAPGS